MPVSFSTGLVKAVSEKYNITQLLGCGESSCAWLTANNNVCKLTPFSNLAEITIRIAKFQEQGNSLVNILAIIEEVAKVKYKATPYYVSITEKLLPICTSEDKNYIWQFIPNSIYSILPLKSQVAFTDLQYLSMAIDALETWLGNCGFVFNGQLWVDNFELLRPDLIDKLRKDAPLFREIPDHILLIAIEKFRRLHEATLQLVISGESLKTGLWPNLVNDAHSGNWGIRDPNDLNSIVLFDFGEGYVLKNNVNQLPTFEL